MHVTGGPHVPAGRDRVRCLLATLPPLLHRHLPLAGRALQGIHSARLPGFLLAGYGQRHAQSHDLLLYEY